MNESPYSQDDQYSSDVSDHSVSTSMNNVLNSLQSEEENETPPTNSVPKPSSSKVDKVCALNLYNFLLIINLKFL